MRLFHSLGLSVLSLLLVLPRPITPCGYGEIVENVPTPLAQPVRQRRHVPSRRQTMAGERGDGGTDGGRFAARATDSALRIHVDSTGLLNDASSCFPGDEGNGRALGSGGGGLACTQDRVGDCTFSCRGDHIVTSERAAAVVSAAGEAARHLSESLGVRAPVSGGLTLVSRACGAPSLSQVPVPVSYDATVGGRGQAGADVVMFLTSRPTFGSAIAYAVTCEEDAAGRAVAAHVNVNPGQIPAAPGSEGSEEWTRAVLTIAHEIVHALGFNSAVFERMVSADGSAGLKAITKVTSAGKAVQTKLLATPSVVAAVRDHFACPTAIGAELEDGGGAGTAATHFEKRVFGDELMTGALRSTEPVLSAITLAALQDTGHYTANFSSARPYPWFRHAGCGALTGCPAGIRTCPSGPGSPGTRTGKAALSRLKLGGPVMRLEAPAPEEAAVCTAGGLVSSCTHLGERGVASLEQFEDPLPDAFNYFPGGGGKIGSPDALSDRCPYPVAFGGSSGTCPAPHPADPAPPAGSRRLCFTTSNSAAGRARALDCLDAVCARPAPPVANANATDEAAAAPVAAPATLELRVFVDGRHAVCPAPGGPVAIPNSGGEVVVCPPTPVYCADPAVVVDDYVAPEQPPPVTPDPGTADVGPNALDRPLFERGNLTSGASIVGPGLSGGIASRFFATSVLLGLVTLFIL